MNIRFGAVPLETLQKAMDTDQAFVQIVDGERKPCRIQGELKPYEGFEPEDIREIASSGNVPGLDLTRPIEMYSLGMVYHTDPRYSDRASHGVAFVQDGQAHNFDALG